MQCVLQRVCTVELFFVSHPGLGGKNEGRNAAGDRRRRRGGFHSSGTLLGSEYLHNQVSAVDVNAESDQEFQIQPTLLSNRNQTPMEKIQRLTLRGTQKWVFLYEKKGHRIYILLNNCTVGGGGAKIFAPLSCLEKSSTTLQTLRSLPFQSVRRKTTYLVEEFIR